MTFQLLDSAVKVFAQMYEVYGHCEEMAREAGKKEKQAMYNKKSLETAAAVSKIFERVQIMKKLEESTRMVAVKEMLKQFRL